jgi:hypothetical protein
VPVYFLLVLTVLVVGGYLLNKSMKENARRRAEEEARLKQAKEGQLRLEEQRKRQEEERQEDQLLDRIVNCPLCRGTLKCHDVDYQRWNDGVDAWMNECYYLPPGSSLPEIRSPFRGRGISQIDCPLCDDGTACARLLDEQETVGCSACGGAGAIEIVKKLDVGATKTRTTCETCHSSGHLSVNHRRLKVKTAKKSGKACYWRSLKEVRKEGNTLVFDLDDSDTARFFSKWRPRTGPQPSG